MPLSALELEPLPSFGELRLARYDEIARMAIVCTTAFINDEQFLWEYPRYKGNYKRIFAHFFHELKRLLASPEHIVLVTFDNYNPEELSKRVARKLGPTGWTPPDTNKDVIVGIGVWCLESNSNRYGTLPVPQGDLPDFPELQVTSMDLARQAGMRNFCESSKEKYFKDANFVELLAVHPAYQRCGHGSKLARWGVHLALIDRVDQGGFCSGSGAALLESVGFEFLGEGTVEGTITGIVKRTIDGVVEDVQKEVEDDCDVSLVRYNVQDHLPTKEFCKPWVVR